MRVYVNNNFWTLITAIPAGIVLAAFLYTVDAVDAVRFALRPVVEMQGELVERRDDGVVLHMHGKKVRGLECEYIAIQSFGDRLVGPPVDLLIARLDTPETGRTKPKGTYDIGHWIVRPTATVVNVRVYVSHDCGGTKWATLIASVPI